MKSIFYRTGLLAIFSIAILISGCSDKSVTVNQTTSLSPATSSFSGDFAYDWTYTTNRIIADQQPNPPKGSRILSYVAVAMYEAVVAGIPNSRSMAGQLRDMPQMPAANADSVYDWPSVLTAATSTVVRGIFDTLYPTSAVLVNTTYNTEYNSRVSSVGQNIVDRSIRHGNDIGAAIIQWAHTDQYIETRTMHWTIPPRTQNPAYWAPINPGDVPTEPFWGLIKPFVLEQPDMFTIHNPYPFDTVPGSPFYADADEISQIALNLTQEQINIALFWNDKLRTPTPPGHWFSIAMQVMQQKHYSLDKAVQVFVAVGAAGRDAFIACWKEKYDKDLLRPETYIRQYIRPDFYPYIQTPSFPEYPSGHSSYSGASSQVLTNLIGDNVTFTDMTNVPINIPPRTFSSFFAAATEAGFSRMYGGIHFRTANLNGIQMGKSIGAYVTSKLKFYIYSN